MFVPRKHNKTGTTSVQVIDKSHRSYRVKSFDVGHTEMEICRLEEKARQYILERQGLANGLFEDEDEIKLETFLSSLSNSQLQVIGPELIFGTLYDRVGYGQIENVMFRHLVITRLLSPGSKLKTIDYLLRYQGVSYDISKIYRFLDNLCHRKNEKEKETDSEDIKTRQIISMTEKRASKDAHNRERGLQRLQKRVASGKLTKSSINSKGYNKYLKMEGNIIISIDMEKFEQDAAWDGIKGYVTNRSHRAEEVIANYRNLWFIERAFRINKTDLEVRPIYHRLHHRIEAHLCICFTAYSILLEMERLLKLNHSSITLKRAQEITYNMYQLNYRLPNTKVFKNQILNMDKDQQELYEIVMKREIL